MLKVVIEYHMPLKTKQGHATSFKVALGDGVGVNTILGMSMIRAAKLNLDMEDNIVTSGILDCAPFPVMYKSVQKSMPNFSNNAGESTVLSTSQIDDDQTKELIKSCISDVFTVHKLEDTVGKMDPSAASTEQEERK